MITTLIFDADGTLCDEADAKIPAELAASELIAEHANITPGEALTIFRESLYDISSSLGQLPDKNNRRLWFAETLRRVGIAESERINPELLTQVYFDALYGEIRPYPDLLSILPWLESNFRLAVLTDEFAEFQRGKLEHMGIYDRFEAVIACDEVGETKPSRRAFEYTLDRLGIAAENAVMIGDNPDADISGAKSVGMKSAWLKRGKYYFFPINDRNRADFSFHSYLQLADWLKAK